MAAVNVIALSEAVKNNRFSAEFFDPRFVFTPKDDANWVPIGRALRKCEYGLSVAMNTEQRGFPMFRMNEISNCFAERPEKYANIPRTLFEAYALNKDDVLFNRTNSFEFVGRTGIVTDQLDCTFASYLIRLVPNREKLLPEFLTVYLNTTFGIGQVKRRAMRSINQANVSGSEIRRVSIVLPDIEEQRSVAALVTAANKELQTSNERYAEAKLTLDVEIGLDRLSFKKPLGHATTFSATMQAGRIDADYFQPPFLQMDAHLAQCPTTPLHALAEIKKGIEVGSAAYQAEGRPFLRVSNIKESGIELGASDKYISPERYAMLREFKPLSGEVLLTKDGSPGVALAVDQEIDGIVSGGVVRLVPRNSNVPIEYLALAINSMACRMQVERECSGALIVHWKPSSIRKLRIPLLSDGKMRTIADRVTQAKLAKRKSRELLEQAKHRVEEMIERAVHQ